MFKGKLTSWYFEMFKHLKVEILYFGEKIEKLTSWAVEKKERMNERKKDGKKDRETGRTKEIKKENCSTAQHVNFQIVHVL